MKVLVATMETAGYRENDFSLVPEYEPVMLGTVCEGHDDPDTSCGCARMMLGVDNLRGTTTFKVVDLLISPAVYISALNNAACRLLHRFNVEEQAEFLLNLASQYPVGTVLERRGEKLFAARPATDDAQR